MSAGHGHDHARGAVGTVRVGFFLTVIILVVEVVVAVFSHSLALLADAGHVLTDLFALGLSWFALKQAERPPDASRTYGYHRTGILVALVNATSLLFISAYILHEAYGRFNEPVEVEGGMMLAAAIVGLLVNLYVGWILSRSEKSNLNIQSALLHVMGDALASMGVIVAGAFIWWTPSLTWLDPAVSVGISLLIALGSWRILVDASHVLMEGVPKGIDIPMLVECIKTVPGVRGVHDLHVWSLASGMHFLTCHVLLDELEVVPSAAVMNEVRDVLQRDFDIDHCTLQPEWELCGPDNLYCTLDMLREMPQQHEACDHEHERGGIR